MPAVMPRPQASPAIRAKAQMELRRRRRQRQPFEAFVRERNESLLDYEHIPKITSVLQQVADGEIKRLMLLLPPRYFKSESVSRLFAAYYLLRYPERHVGLAAYGAQLAWELSEEARNYFEASGGILRQETAAKRRWRTSDGGEMWADGVGGSLLGRGYNLGIIDDPVDPEKAHSPTYQARFRKWWPSKFLSRQEPGAAIVMVMQRLGTDDPVDWLWRREVGDDADLAPEHWHVVCMDEIKSSEPLANHSGPRGIPSTCTTEPDGRKEDELLAPSRFGREQVESLQRVAGPYVRDAQRQQRPAAPSGDFWQKAWFGVYDELPESAYNGGKDWDTAYTKDERNSASAFVESYRDRGEGGDGQEYFRIYIHDVGWEWYEFPELIAWMKRIGGPHYVEEKASGKSVAQTLRREGLPVTEVPVEGGDKFARAAGVQPIASAGRVLIRRPIMRQFLQGDRQGILRVTAEGLESKAAELDLNDAFVQALNRHAKRPVHLGVDTITL